MGTWEAHDEARGEERTRERDLAEIRHYDRSKTVEIEAEFVQATVGLQSADEYRAKRQALESKVNRAIYEGVVEAITKEVEPELEVKEVKAPSKIKKLSFGDESEESDEVSLQLIHKDTSVDTSHLPDKGRLEKLRLLHIELTEKYQEEREKKMNSRVKICFSYWDGAGHRDDVNMLQKDSVFDFLCAARTKLINTSMPQVQKIRVENLLFVKEDIILPNDISFFELREKEAWGKTGPLYDFEVYDDLRINADIRTAGRKSHPGKIVTRSWYELNKHTYPASLWESFDGPKAFRKNHSPTKDL